MQIPQKRASGLGKMQTTFKISRKRQMLGVAVLNGALLKAEV